MSYQVLARKWRPATFSELVGQEHVRRALVNALDHDRLHHAFLFTGTRGVGKTTIARILAKSLNCDAGVSSTPCGACTACQEISEGRFVDLIEVDAASRTKVEDTRELLENVQYAPTRARYKVYLIDEVHMLSNHSFNALLKTLEEPPPHVKFLLATTDPQRLPVTILSRCLQFNLKRIPIQLIEEHLKNILTKENIAFEKPALLPIANAADGSMRDALSLMDQAIAYCAGNIKSVEVSSMLGNIDQHFVYDILLALAKNDINSVLQQVEKIAEFATEFESVLVDILSVLHHLAIAQLAPDNVNDVYRTHAQFKELTQQLGTEDIQLFYQIALNGRRDLALAPSPQTGFEMTILRMLAFKPASIVKPSTTTTKGHSSASTVVQQQSNITGSQINNPIKNTTPKTEELNPKSSATTINSASLDWEQLVSRTKLKGITQQLAKHCALKNYSENKITLEIAELHKQLLNKNRQIEIEQALQKLLSTNISLQIVTSANPGNTPAIMEEKRQVDKLNTARQEIENDQTVKSIIDTFDAEINIDSIEPLN